MLDQLIAYESGELSEEDTIDLFQQLLDSRILYSLQGFYQRAAQDMIAQGLITKKSS